MNMNIVKSISVALLLFASACAAAGSARAAERPNILLIVSEDNGPELGCYGEPSVRTPVLDRLAAEGVRFQNAYVPQAGCSQSRAALLSGRYPHENGQIGLATWKFRMYRDDAPNVVRGLKQAGYRTGIIGKLHVNPESAFPFDLKKIPSSNFGRKKLGAYAREAEKFFAAGDEPFFLSVNYPDAHRPFVKQAGKLPTQPLGADDVKPLAYIGLDTPRLRADTADYYNSISRLDSLVGDLLEALGRSGKADDTLIVYLGDHGADLPRGKRTSHEGGLRIPLIVRWPGKAKRGQVRDELVSTLDLAPTFLAVAGEAIEADLPGRSLLPLLRGEKGPWRRYLFTEFHLHSAHDFYPQRTVRNERYKLIQNLMPDAENPGYDYTMRRFYPKIQATIDGAPEPVRSAYLRMKTPPEFELYDLQNDPREFRNLADGGETNAEVAATLAELKKELTDWRMRTADPLLDAANLRRLKREIDACFVDGEPDKERLELNYPEYFFTNSSAAQGEPRAEAPVGGARVVAVEIDRRQRQTVAVAIGKPGVVMGEGMNRSAGRVEQRDCLARVVQAAAEVPVAVFFAHVAPQFKMSVPLPSAGPLRGCVWLSSIRRAHRARRANDALPIHKRLAPPESPREKNVHSACRSFRQQGAHVQTQYIRRFRRRCTAIAIEWHIVCTSSRFVKTPRVA
jgi:N-sulfoglucosamine sulfohydrolase